MKENPTGLFKEIMEEKFLKSNRILTEIFSIIFIVMAQFFFLSY